jgi:hypothetical protein
VVYQGVVRKVLQDMNGGHWVCMGEFWPGIHENKPVTHKLCKVLHPEHFTGKTRYKKDLGFTPILNQSYEGCVVRDKKGGLEWVLTDEKVTAIGCFRAEYGKVESADVTVEKKAQGGPLKGSDAKLKSALHACLDAESRWKERRRLGLSDADLRRAISEEFGIAGSGTGSGSYRGGGDPAWWASDDANPRKDKPALKGGPLVAAVRRIMEIPQPSAKSADKKAPKAAAVKVVLPDGVTVTRVDWSADFTE